MHISLSNDSNDISLLLLMILHFCQDKIVTDLNKNTNISKKVYQMIKPHVIYMIIHVIHDSRLYTLYVCQQFFYTSLRHLGESLRQNWYLKHILELHYAVNEKWARQFPRISHHAEAADYLLRSTSNSILNNVFFTDK